MRPVAIAQTGAIFFVGILLGLLAFDLTHQPPPPKVGQRAPGFALPRLGGVARGGLSLAAFRGRPVVLNFWASDCRPCAAEAQALEKLYYTYRKAGLAVLGVDVKDSTADAEQFVRDHGITYPSVVDSRGTLVASYRLLGTPETFVIDRRGRLLGDPILGPIGLPSNHQQVNSLLRAALSSTSSSRRKPRGSASGVQGGD